MSDFICGKCRYFGFHGLRKFCRHPLHVVELKKKSASRCPDFLDTYTKDIPGKPSQWPDPVNLRELIQNPEKA